MATITKKSDARLRVGSTPWGNAHALRYTLATSSTGAALVSDSAQPVKSGDKVRLGLIPAGCELLDAHTVVSGGIEGLAGSLGFEYVDGADDAQVPQDASYFSASVNLADAARLAADATKAPVVLPKDAWLTLTASANATGAGRADVVLLVAAQGVA